MKIQTSQTGLVKLSTLKGFLFDYHVAFLVTERFCNGKVAKLEHNLNLLVAVRQDELCSDILLSTKQLLFTNSPEPFCKDWRHRQESDKADAPSIMKVV